MIYKDPRLAYAYANETGKRFLMGEPAIMQFPHFTYWYWDALFNHKRWPEAEPIIQRDKRMWDAYKTRVLD